MATEKEYFAFISYQREDEEWAKWLAHELEHYHFPVTLNGRKDLPKDLRPIFRDIDELSAGNLPNQIHKALANSKHLIVICSPRSAQSKWVNKEIEEFINMNKTDKIFPFIIDGKAYAEKETDDCFPPALRNLPREEERLGGNINEMGRDAAVVKIVAGMLDLDFDALWQRYEREKVETEQKTREINNKILRNQSRFIAEKVLNLINEGNSYIARLLAIEVLPKDLDYPERPYTIEAEKALRLASLNESAVLEGHTDNVLSVKFSPDGLYIASASADRTIRLWDTMTGKQIKILMGHSDSVFSVAYSPDGTKLASCSEDMTIRIWNVKNGSLIKTIQGLDVASDSIEFSPNGKQIITARWDKSVHIRDSQTGELLSVLKGHTDFVSSISYSADGKYIATGSHDNTICIWNSQNALLLRVLKGHTDEVLSVSFSPSGKYLVSGSRDNTIRIWDGKTGDMLHILEGHLLPVRSVQFSWDERIIISASDDHSIRIWDTISGQQLRVLEKHTNEINSIAICKQNNRIVSSSLDNTIRIWDTLMNIGRRTFMNQYNGGNIIDICPKRMLLITISPDNTVIVLNIKTGEPIIAIKGHYFKNPTFTSDGKYFLSVFGKNIGIWDTFTGEHIKTIDGDVRNFHYACMNPKCNYIASTSWDKKCNVHLWDFNTGKLIKDLMGHTNAVCSICFSPDGEHVVTASCDNTIRIWDINNFSSIILRGHFDAVNYAKYSSDGKFIVSASRDHTVRIWDAKTGKQLKKLEGHTSNVKTAEFSPDNNYIISASFDIMQSIRIWDVNTGNQVYYIDGHSNHAYYHAVFGQNGASIIAASGNHNIYIYDFPPLQMLINKTKHRFENRQLTQEERKKYYLD